MSQKAEAATCRPCVRCSTMDSVFVLLECHHQYCLVCTSYLFIKSRAQGGNNSDSVVCCKCSQTSLLDSVSVEAVKATI